MTGSVDTDALRESSRALTKRAAYAMFDGDFNQQNQMQELANRTLLAADELDRLRTVIENAPHGYPCNVTQQLRDEHPCTCWKADAL